MTKKYLVLAFYHFIEIENPHAEVSSHKQFFHEKDITSRIYISKNGINGQMCASEEDGEAYIKWMHEHPLFKSIHFKIHFHHEQVFPRKTVKYREHLVGHDNPVDLSKRGLHVSPDQWKQMMEKKEDYLLLDIRNDYEWELGRFEGATLPPCETFREFENYADSLNEDDKKNPVMMYCTGGIRCELYSSILIEKGFKDVYQLDGGIINYGLKEGSKHWLGKLFVFDDRLSVPISDEESPIIGTCYHCETPSDSYYNCANMDCNKLFLSCKKCINEYLGSCCKECQNSDRVRPYHQHNPHKPFRRKSYYSKLDNK